MKTGVKISLGVLSFVAVATVARRVGQYEELDTARASFVSYQEGTMFLKDENNKLRAENDKLHTEIEERKKSHSNGIQTPEWFRGYDDGIMDYKTCKTGHPGFCEAMLMDRVRQEELAGRINNIDEPSLVYDHGNYKKGLEGFLDRMDMTARNEENDEIERMAREHPQQ
jgi:hypothetical protein